MFTLSTSWKMCRAQTQGQAVCFPNTDPTGSGLVCTEWVRPNSPCRGRTGPACSCCSASVPGRNTCVPDPGCPCPPGCTSPAGSHQAEGGGGKLIHLGSDLEQFVINTRISLHKVWRLTTPQIHDIACKTSYVPINWQFVWQVPLSYKHWERAVV